MRVEVLLPQWGMGTAEGTVTEWMKAVGDEVAKDEPIVEVETAKAIGEVESPVAGVLVEILVQVDETIPVGSPLAIVETSS